MMPKVWEKQADESDEWFGRFCVFLALGYSRSLAKAYRAVHPDSEAREVSASWRAEYRSRKWRRRATEYDLSLFQDQARETAVDLGRAMRAYSRKTLKALLSKEPAMRPANWEEAARAFETLWRLFAAEVIHDLAKPEEVPPGVSGDDEDELQDEDESFYLSREKFLEEVPPCQNQAPFLDGGPAPATGRRA